MSAAVSSSHSAFAEFFASKPLILIGGGKMGGALLEGWLRAGVDPARVVVVDPSPSEILTARAAEAGFRVATASDEAADVAPAAALVVAVKPQMLGAALPEAMALLDGESVLVSVAAGAQIARFAAVAPEGAAIIRAMPNTPAAVGAGITALYAEPAVGERARRLAGLLLEVVGETAWLDAESQMDAVTGVSGSGPAYVFHMIEALAAAGEAEGLAPELAMRLARQTVIGAGMLADASEKPASQLRVDVTSPGGTTAAGLAQLMDEESGLSELMRRTVAAAAARSRELGA